MTLQSSAPISASDINVELGRNATAVFHLNGSSERTLAGKSSGAVKFSDFLGKGSDSGGTTGTKTFSSSGTFTVPTYTSMTVTVLGAGGGGGASSGNDGGGGHEAGGDGSGGGSSKFDFGATPPTASGGGGGEGGGSDLDPGDGAGGSNGGGSGGTATSGGGAAGGEGGISPQAYSGGDGGAGGKVVKTYTSATGPTAAGSVTITVGVGGGGGVHPRNIGANGGHGVNGAVTITWS